MATEKKDENDEQVEQVEQFKTLSKKINDKSSRSEMITMLVSFFEYENYDILQLVKDCITLDDYDLLLGRVGKAGNVIQKMFLILIHFTVVLSFQWRFRKDITTRKDCYVHWNQLLLRLKKELKRPSQV
jgi:hypothetical protein